METMSDNDTFYWIIQNFFFVSWLIIILCTSTILVITIRYWRCQCRSILNLLMCHSSACLFVFALTYSIQIPYFNTAEPNPFYCRIAGCLATFGTGLAAYSCIVQAISRFFTTILYKHRVLASFRTNWILIITIWLLTAIISGGMFLSSSAYQYEPESHFCILTTKNFLTSTLAVLFFIVTTVVLLIILYGIIVYHTIRHTRMNPNSRSTLRAQKNKRLFHKVIFSVMIHALGGIPYIIAIIYNRISIAPWPLYSIAGLSFSIVCAIHAVFLLMINDQVKSIISKKLFNKTRQLTIAVTSTKRNQVLPSTQHIWYSKMKAESF